MILWIRFVWLLFLKCLLVCGQSRPPRITEHPSDVLVRKHEPATLNCKAEGRPPPSIEWFHDGAPVLDNANRMVLDGGSLFFLHVLHTKREQDTGTYWCQASNEFGKARSWNATLEVAVLREDFRVSPKSVAAAVGESATLECSPPKGHPEPKVKWRKDGDVISTVAKGRMRVVPPGNLVISEVRQNDEGRYSCIAENMAGMRESLPVHMAVHVKPFFVKEPDHLTVLANVEVTFPCQVEGDPSPSVTWRRKDGKIPVGRADVSDGSLVIRNVNVADEGTYICEAENSVGAISSEVSLTVHSRPNFLVKPKDQRVGLSGIAKMECSATGNPPPSIFWTKEGNQILMFPERSYGKFLVSRDGTLTISGVSKEDDGYYICSVLSGIGSSMAKAYLEVTAIGDLPAPIIKLGPANQTLPLNTIAMLPCEATGEPRPTIKWFVNSVPIQSRNPRYVVLDSGTLQIADLKSEDSGTFTCTASSESGETSWSAALTVASPMNPNTIFHRMPDSITYPGPPSKPVATNITETSVTLSWKKNTVGSSPIMGYNVEYYSSDLQSGWLVVAHRVDKETFLVSNLRPDTRYMFLVRAENSYGLGFPSEVSDVIRTPGFSSGVPHFNLIEARNRLNDVTTFLQNVVSLSSTSVKMIWKVQGASGYIEGFYIRFLDLSGGSQKYNMVTVLNGGSSSYILSDLKKYTKYEFFLVPFYKNIEGPPSNSKTAQTLEDVPSAPPVNLQVRIIGPNSATISWSPPPPQHRNGLLQGYSIRVLNNSSQLHAQISTNATTTSVTITNLTEGSVYNIKAAALTSSGLGPFSPSIHPKIEYGAVTFSDNPSVMSDLGDIVRQPWFIAVVGGLIFILLSAFFIILFLRRRKAWKKELQAHLSGPVHKPEDVQVGVSARETLWINQAWHPVQVGKNCLPDGKLLNNSNPGMDRSYISGGASDYAEVDTHNMTTFYKKELPCIPAPYATTTLINPSARHHSGSVHDGKSSGSEMSKKSDKMYDMEARLIEDCVTEQLLDARNVISPSSDSGSYTTDEYGLPIRRKRLRSGQKGSVLNWMEFIPPPPEHPPSGRASPAQGISNVRVNPYPIRNVHSQLPLDNCLNSNLSPQVTRSLQSSALARHNPSSPWSQSLTRAPEERAPTPPSNAGGRYPLVNNYLTTQQSYGSSPGVDRGVQSSLLSLASDPCPVNKKGMQDKNAKVNSLKSNPGILYHQLHPELITAQERVRYDNVMQSIQRGSPSPTSSIHDEGEYAPGQCPAPSWTSVTDRSSTSSARSSVASSSDGSVYTDSDFANVVARAAQNAGFHLFRQVSPPTQPSKLDSTSSSLLSPIHNC